MNITVSTNELYVKGGKSGVEIVTFTSTEPIQVTYEQITNGLNGYTRVSIVDNFTTNVTWKIEYSGLNVHNEIYKGEIHARLTGSDEDLVVPVTIDCSVPSTNRIETTCKTLYVKGEKNGTETVVFTCAEPIEVTYEQFTNNLNGNVRVWIENNFTNEVTWNVEYSDLYLYGETYSGLIHARLSGDVDSLDVPVVINCSDTLIYSDVPNDTVIEVEEGIHITYSSLPEVNKVWIVFEDGTETDITDLLNGQTIDLTYEYLLNRFGVADYDYICATNGLSQITHKLNKVVYKLEIIGAAFKRIDWKMQRVSFILRSTRNNKSCGFDVSASDGSKVDVFYINGDTGIYKISCLVDGNGLDIEREIILNVVQRESKYEVRFKILQGVYVYIPGMEGNEFIYRAEKPTMNRLYLGGNMPVGTSIIDAFLDDIPYDDYEFDGIVGVEYNYKFKVKGTDYSNLFYYCPIYKVVKFDTSNATDMSGMFNNCSSLTTIPPIDTRNVTSMSGMFENCSSLTTIPPIDTRNVTNMYDMFNGCTSLTSIPLSDTSNVTNMLRMFENCSSLTTIPQLDTSNVTLMRDIFYNCSSLTSIPLLNTRNVTSMYGMFENCSSLTSIPLLDTIGVTDMSCMFSGCTSLTSIPLLDTRSVTSMYGMFSGCTSLTSIPLLDTSDVTNMDSLFNGCTTLKEIPKFDTNYVSGMNYMFYNCSSLTTIPQLNTRNITSMYYMFYNCSSLTTIPQLNTSKVIDMQCAFRNCSLLTSIPLLDTSKVNETWWVFKNCSSLTNIGGFKNLKTDLDLSDSPLLTHESLMNVINNLASVVNEDLSLGDTNLNKLTDDEKMIAINKGWVLS